MFNLIKRDSRQPVKTKASKINTNELKDMTIMNREEIDKLKEEIEAINRTVETERKKSKKRNYINLFSIFLNFALIVILIYFLINYS